SRFIDAIPSHPEDFKTYREDYVFDGTIKLGDAALKKYMVSEKDRQRLNPQIARAYITHLRGDEVRPATILDKTELGLWGRLILALQGDLIDGWYTDLPPADNQVTIDLTDGTYQNN
ncbi:MAG: hypothetical protein ABIK68_03500, partial [bacterium]